MLQGNFCYFCLPKRSIFQAKVIYWIKS